MKRAGARHVLPPWGTHKYDVSEALLLPYIASNSDQQRDIPTGVIHELEALLDGLLHIERSFHPGCLGLGG